MKKIVSIYFLLFLVLVAGQAQDKAGSLKINSNQAEPPMKDNLLADSIYLQGPVDTITVSVISTDTLLISDSTAVKFKPDPQKSIWLGAVIPGYGHIVNKKYWKLPIVYGGFMGFAYAISWNNSRYLSYKNAYRDISDNDPNTNYHLEILPRGYTMENYPGGEATYKTRLKSAQDQFRQYRDLSILLSIGYYALVLLDAYVDAQLYDFDISNDLVLNVAPARIEYNRQNSTRSAIGLQCSIRF